MNTSLNKRIYALVDCNNFYASCERAFMPLLKKQPIIILSNNDGCVVALSDEAKKLGLKVGNPVFQIKDIIIQHNIFVFSSNYELYGDMSRRVMNILAAESSELEIYSIDEAFVSLDGMQGDLAEYGRSLREKVLAHAWIPVSIGIGPTKTLAKIASKIAKKDPFAKGAVDLVNHPDLDRVLEQIPVDDIWGVGERKSGLLHSKQIHTALDLKNTSDNWVRKHLGGITGLKTTWELRGIPCIDLEPVRSDKKQIISSKSFGILVTDFRHLYEAVSTYTCLAAEKLRQQKSLAGSLSVLVGTNQFRTQDDQYHYTGYAKLPAPTSDTALLLNYAEQLLKKIYREGYNYKRAGVILTDIEPEVHCTPGLFGDCEDEEKRKALMKTIDKLNKANKGIIKFASNGLYQHWQMSRKLLSPCYTTRWNQVLTVKV